MRNLQVNVLPAALSQPSMLTHRAQSECAKSNVIRVGQRAVAASLQVASAMDTVSGAEEEVQTPTGSVLLLPNPHHGLGPSHHAT